MATSEQIAQELEDLYEARRNIASQLKDLTLHPKPSYSVDGQTYQWSAYFRMLADMRREIQDQINALEGPRMDITQGFTT